MVGLCSETRFGVGKQHQKNIKRTGTGLQVQESGGEQHGRH